MGLLEFMMVEIAMDLGTVNTLMIFDGKIVVDSPSIIARDLRSEKIIAFGSDASLMQGKTHENIQTIRPLKEGVIADLDASEKMISWFINNIPGIKKKLFGTVLRMMICIPTDITEMEIRAIKESCTRVRGKEILFIHEPLASAIGLGLDVMKPQGIIIVDIGGGTTKIAVISLGGIICSKSVKIAGDVFTNDIINYVKDQHCMQIGIRSAEKIKIKIGAATDELEEVPEEITVRGGNVVTGSSKTIKINYMEIIAALDKSIQIIEDAIILTLSMTPPELAADIYRTGLYLAGGSAMLRGLDRRISKKTGLEVFVGADPIHATVIGTNIALKNKFKYQRALIK
ncbi:rod shape-determining protein [Flavobacterium sp. A45]|uniref:rod shape-determining protein n=1 Tax=Flavobacterium sp. A45 TaxID=1945862 RepID=UPI000986D94E|nr:rod shape-determining protein [Flavobacterium sp. A45]OOG65793.1 rod shape-determining protein [Flavobacterium sp. A45]